MNMNKLWPETPETPSPKSLRSLWKNPELYLIMKHLWQLQSVFEMLENFIAVICTKFKAKILKNLTEFINQGNFQMSSSGDPKISPKSQKRIIFRHFFWQFLKENFQKLIEKNSGLQIF